MEKSEENHNKIINVKFDDKLELKEPHWKKDRNFLLAIFSIVISIIAIIISLIVAFNFFDSFNPEIYISNYVFNIDQKSFDNLNIYNNIGLSIYFYNTGNKEGVIEDIKLVLINQDTRSEYVFRPSFRYYAYNSLKQTNCHVNETYPPFFVPLFLDKKSYFIGDYYFILNDSSKKLVSGTYEPQVYIKKLGDNNFEIVKTNTFLVKYAGDVTHCNLISTFNK